MYVCVCNAISDRDVRAHVEAEDCTVAAVYRALGKPPKCGKCVPLMCSLVRQAAILCKPQSAPRPG